MQPFVLDTHHACAPPGWVVWCMGGKGKRLTRGTTADFCSANNQARLCHAVLCCAVLCCSTCCWMATA
jgi:hypothetical protein